MFLCQLEKALVAKYGENDEDDSENSDENDFADENDFDDKSVASSTSSYSKKMIAKYLNSTKSGEIEASDSDNGPKVDKAVISANNCSPAASDPVNNCKRQLKYNSEDDDDDDDVDEHDSDDTEGHSTTSSSHQSVVSKYDRFSASTSSTDTIASASTSNNGKKSDKTVVAAISRSPAEPAASEPTYQPRQLRPKKPINYYP